MREHPQFVNNKTYRMLGYDVAELVLFIKRQPIKTAHNFRLYTKLSQMNLFPRINGLDELYEMVIGVYPEWVKSVRENTIVWPNRYDKINWQFQDKYGIHTVRMNGCTVTHYPETSR